MGQKSAEIRRLIVSDVKNNVSYREIAKKTPDFYRGHFQNHEKA